MPIEETRKLHLAPEDVSFTPDGELVVRSERLRAALEEGGVKPDTALASDKVEVSVTVSVKF